MYENILFINLVNIQIVSYRTSDSVLKFCSLNKVRGSVYKLQYIIFSVINQNCDVIWKLICRDCIL